jgi:hypothetical protein
LSVTFCQLANVRCTLSEEFPYVLRAEMLENWVVDRRCDRHVTDHNLGLLDCLSHGCIGCEMNRLMRTERPFGRNRHRRRKDGVESD